MEEFYLDSCGAGRLHCALWKPEGEPKAVVQLIHGIAEHIGRYDAFAKFLTQHGYVVAADDHMGHGGSAENGLRGYFSGGWLSAVEDEKHLHDEISAQYPDLPYYILGHSMGSFLLRTYLYTYPDAVDKAVISGTGWEAAIAFLAAIIFAPVVGIVPAAATAPALIFVGILMLSNIKEVDFSDMTNALPAFCTIVFMPFTYSIANGAGTRPVFGRCGIS